MHTPAEATNNGSTPCTSVCSGAPSIRKAKLGGRANWPPTSAAPRWLTALPPASNAKTSASRPTTLTINRSADAAGLSYWAGQFAHGVTNEDLIAGFVGSPEYFAHAANSSLAVSAQLADDTGESNSDGLTNDPTIAGKLIDTTTITSFTAVVELNTSGSVTKSTDLKSVLQADGTFSLGLDEIANIFGFNQTPPASTVNGQHTVTLQAGDAAGNTASLDVSFTLDEEPPTIALTGPADGQATGDNVTVTGQVSNAVSGVAGLHAAVDSGPPADVTVDAGGHFSFTTQLSLDGSADGPHVVHFVATDVAGNVSPSADYHFTLQSSKPAIVIDNTAGQTVNQSFPVTGQATNLAGGTFTLQAALDNGSFTAVSLESRLLSR